MQLNKQTANILGPNQPDSTSQETRIALWDTHFPQLRFVVRTSVRTRTDSAYYATTGRTNASQRLNENKNMGSKSRTGLIATGCAVFAFVFVLIAFVTPCWLETDGQLEKPKFIRIGKSESHSVP